MCNNKALGASSAGCVFRKLLCDKICKLWITTESFQSRLPWLSLLFSYHEKLSNYTARKIASFWLELTYLVKADFIAFLWLVNPSNELCMKIIALNGKKNRMAKYYKKFKPNKFFITCMYWQRHFFYSMKMSPATFLAFIIQIQICIFIFIDLSDPFARKTESSWITFVRTHNGTTSHRSTQHFKNDSY